MLTIALWKVFLFIFSIVLLMFITSSIICASDEECRYHIPTVSNMLNSTMTTPFVVSGFGTSILFHLLSSLSLYCITCEKAYYWSILQVLFAIFFYIQIVITLFVLPFTGWENNWANISVLVVLLIWMLLTQVSIKRGLQKAFRQTLIPFSIFAVSVLVYIIVRAVPQIPLNGRDAGIMVCEVIGALSFIAFMLICIWQVRFLGIQIIRPNINDNGVYAKFQIDDIEQN